MDALLEGRHRRCDRRQVGGSSFPLPLRTSAFPIPHDNAFRQIRPVAQPRTRSVMELCCMKTLLVTTAACYFLRLILIPLPSPFPRFHFFLPSLLSPFPSSSFYPPSLFPPLLSFSSLSSSSLETLGGYHQQPVGPNLYDQCVTVTSGSLVYTQKFPYHFFYGTYEH